MRTTAMLADDEEQEMSSDANSFDGLPDLDLQQLTPEQRERLRDYMKTAEGVEMNAWAVRQTFVVADIEVSMRRSAVQRAEEVLAKARQAFADAVETREKAHRALAALPAQS